ncbi:AraC family transcriptional regulator [Rhizobiales bacterium GAS191]|nr:AraC family transcriptional regulator [Rhizobiales bacterium GAS191]
MNPIEKALWFIENRLTGEISLQAIAHSAGVSNHHLARAFGAATGQSLMRYARGRRLSEAARSLIAGAPDILTVALDAGYGSHEAFTRAFREQFGVTSDYCRSVGSIDQIQLVEPIRMDKSLLIGLAEPHFEELKELLIAGYGARYTFETNQGIPAQWQRFGPHIGNVARQVGPETHGVACNFDNGGSFEYIAGVQVSDFGALPEGFATVRIPAERYAVFRHPEHVSMLRRTHYTIWNKWLPASGMAIADAPNFERYGKEFNPMTGTGPIEVWMPVGR